MLKQIKTIHFVGIGGAGMSALARILLEKGFEVTGSDLSDSPFLEQLKKLGVHIYTKHEAENVHKADAIVISTAIPKMNPEIVEAKRLGLQCFHRSDINAALLNASLGIAVAGSHGKTTTTAMLGVALEYAGISPSIIIGGEVDLLGGNAKLGKGEYLVSEADESDGSFLKLLPHIAIVTNIEDDHLDHYGTLENIRQAFIKFLGNIKPNGFAVLCFDNENVRLIEKKITCKVISYAIDHEADYLAKNIRMQGSGIGFSVMHAGKDLGRIQLNMPGRHNVLDALAAVVTGISIGLTVEQMAQGLALFQGAKRRFQTKGCVKDIWIVDDYAHHPTEVATTLLAARQTKPRRLVCAFQPHRYSRTKLLANEFATAFSQADVLVLTDVYAAGEAVLKGISGRTIFDAVQHTAHKDVTYIKAREDLAAHLAAIAKPGDLIITMGAGDIYKSGEELLTLLEGK